MSGPGAAADGAGAAAVRAALARLLRDGPPAWVVGGAVRAALRGEPTDDVDVALDAAADADAVRRVVRAVARELGGHAFALSDAFGAWRATSAPGSTPAWQLDVTPLQGRSLADDLALRDLTVNALAEPVGGGPLVDRFGGRSDLQEGVLRIVAPDALQRDPVRVVRLARFAAELNARPDEEAIAASRAVAPALPSAPGERVLPELLRALTGEGWRRGLEVLGATGALAALLPAAVGDGGDVPPAAVAALAVVLGAPGPTVRDGVAAPDADELGLRARSARGRSVLVLATLLSAAPDPAVALRGLRPSGELRAGVARATAAARAVLALPADVAGARALHDALAPARTDAPEALLLAHALRPGASLPWAALAARAVRRAAGPPRAPVSGDVLARELGLRPGPELGGLLRELAIAHDAGELAGPDDAVEHARGLLARERRAAHHDG